MLAEELYLAQTQVPTGVELTNSTYWQKLENEDPNSPPKGSAVIQCPNRNRTTRGNTFAQWSH